MAECHFQSQTSNWSQTFLQSQTHLLKGLLRDKGSSVPGCKDAFVQQWLRDQENTAAEIEREFKALIRAWETMLAEPRPFNLRRVKTRNKAPQLQWRLPSESGNQVVVALFDESNATAQEALAPLPAPFIAMLFEIEVARATLNWISNLSHSMISSTEEFVLLKNDRKNRRMQLLYEKI